MREHWGFTVSSHPEGSKDGGREAAVFLNGAAESGQQVLGKS